ncbi:hypothetical protein [Pseudomonas sp. LRF_L74]|uniref:hypothetical protein n=1 Tax=Pseudomonas sp. LRF_L74 TaxID=3369422 RepID=UPI003F5E155C
MQRSSQFFLYCLVGLVATAAITLLLFLRDEPLDVEAAAWLSAVNSQRESSEGYIYLLGLDALDEPLLVGHARQDEFRHWRTSHGLLDSAFVPQPVRQLITAPALRQCNEESWYCAMQLTPQEQQALLTDGQELLRRYQEVARFDSLQRHIAFDSSSPIPDYGLLLAGNRLLVLLAYQEIREGRPDKARSLLEQDNQRWRKHLANADSLIQKVVITRLLSANLATLSTLYQQDLAPQPHALAPLSPSERSLQTAMRSEFVLAANGLLAMPDDEHTLARPGRLAMYLLFKPNMSVNAVLPRYRRIAMASQLEAGEYVEWLKTPAEAQRQGWRNPIGNTLLGIAGPDMTQYLTRLHDLDARIRLFNRLAALDPGFATADALAMTAEGNPYGMGGARLEKGPTPRLCYPGPAADDMSRRCLPLFSRD